jgi:hypothetical protein
MMYDVWRAPAYYTSLNFRKGISVLHPVGMYRSVENNGVFPKIAFPSACSIQKTTSAAAEVVFLCFELAAKRLLDGEKISTFQPPQ